MKNKKQIERNRYYLKNKDRDREIERLKKWNDFYREYKKEYMKRYREKNKERLIISFKEWKKRNKTKLSKYFKIYNKKYYLINKEKLKKNTRDYSLKNKDKRKKYMKDYSKKNMKRIKRNRKKWMKRNINKYRKFQREWQKNKRKNNKDYNLLCRLRMSLYKALRNYHKRGKILKSNFYGIDYKKIIEYLKPFPEDLSKYDVDHIKPLNSFDLNKPTEIKKAFSPNNLQWLLSGENRRKGKKIVIQQNLLSKA